MEDFVVLLIPALLGVLMVRTLLMPLRLIWKPVIHAGCGFLCLWLINAVSGFTGLVLPVNAVTVALAGVLGVPGIGIIVLLEVLTGV